MTRSVKIYIGLLLLLFALAVAIELSKPQPIDWAPTYNETHKSPYGTFIFYNELKSLFPASEIEDLAETPYEFFVELYDWNSLSYRKNGTYIFIDAENTIDEVSAEKLLDFASYGNDIFISSNYFPPNLSDSLKFEIDIAYDFTGDAKFNLANSVFIKDSIQFDKGVNHLHFSKLDSLKSTVLGYQNLVDMQKINFVKVKYGLGSFYLHLQPIVFTNYNLLKKNNKKYASAVMSYLPDETIFFDSRNKKRLGLSKSPLRFILSQPALKWAWILGLFSIIVFIIFNAKRKQRIVDVIKPLDNSTVAFTKTIGNLYYETKDHNNLIDKKITYFLEHLRRVYYLDTQQFDEKFAKKLSLKSGRDLNKTKQLINLIAHLKANQYCNENDLLNLNRAIENFHNT